METHTEEIEAQVQSPSDVEVDGEVRQLNTHEIIARNIKARVDKERWGY